MTLWRRQDPSLNRSDLVPVPCRTTAYSTNVAAPVSSAQQQQQGEVEWEYRKLDRRGSRGAKPGVSSQPAGCCLSEGERRVNALVGLGQLQMHPADATLRASTSRLRLT